MSFSKQNVINFDGFKFINIFLLSIVLFVSCLKPLCQTPGQKDFSPFFSFKSFIFLHFIFRSMIHLESTFVQSVRFRSSLNFLPTRSNYSNTICQKKLFFLLLMFFDLLSKMSSPYLCGSISGCSILGCCYFLFFVFFLYKSTLFPNCLDYCSLRVSH